MPVFGITGNLAGGKSTVAEFLRKKGAKIYDLDKRIHQYYRDQNGFVYRKVIFLFPEIISKKGVISRRKLGEAVFGDVKALKKLEQIVHPAVISDLKQWVRTRKGKEEIYVVEAPLLFEKKLQKLFQGVILVTAKKEILLARIQLNLGVSLQKARERLELFMPVKDKKKQADFIVENNADIESLERKVDWLWEDMLQVCKKANIRR